MPDWFYIEAISVGNRTLIYSVGLLTFHLKRGERDMSRWLRFNALGRDAFGRSFKSRKHEQARRRRSMLLESLEDRRMLTGTITITGTAGDDTLQLKRNTALPTAELEYSLNGSTFTKLGYATQLVFDGGAGNDVLNVDLSGVSIGTNYLVTETSIEGLSAFTGTDVTFAGVETLSFLADNGNNTVTVDLDNQVTSLTNATINSGSGDDRILLAGVTNLTQLNLLGGIGNDTFSSPQGRLAPSSSTTIVLSGETSTAFDPAVQAANNVGTASGDMIELDLGVIATQPELLNARSGHLFSGVTATNATALHKPLYFNGLEAAKVWSDNQLTNANIGDLLIRGTSNNDSMNFSFGTGTTITTTINGSASLAHALDAGKKLFIQAGNGNDSITANGNGYGTSNVVNVEGGVGNDSISLSSAFKATSEVAGGLGDDTINTYGPTVAVWGDEATTGYDRQGKVGDGNDIIRTQDENASIKHANRVFGGGGNDTIYTYGGDDYVLGGLGDDTIYVGAGNDLARGGDGNDYLFTGDTGYTGYAADGNDILLGEAGSDTFTVGLMFARDIIIGGADGDNFTNSTNSSSPGVTGDKIVVAGITSYDKDNGLGSNLGSNDNALIAIRNEWGSTATATNRIAHLSNTLSGGLNAGNYFAASTVFEDNAWENSAIIKIAYDQGVTAIANHWLIGDGTMSSITFKRYYSSHPDPITTTNIFTTVLPTSMALPQLAPDSYSTNEDTPLIIPASGVLANDASPVGLSLTATLPSTPTSGSLSLLSTGAFTYTPAANFAGTATFTYKATDGTNMSNPTTVTITVNAVNDAPVLSAIPATTDYTHDGITATIIAPSTGLTDVDSTNLAGGSLAVFKEDDSTALANDRLEIKHQGTAAGQIGISGVNVTYGNVAIGSFTGGSGNVPLTISFLSTATPAAVQALLRTITFRNINAQNPSGANRSISFVLTDGAGGVATANCTVQFVVANMAPVVYLGGTATYTEDAAPTPIFSAGTVTDADSLDFISGYLSIKTNPAIDSNDLFGIQNIGDGAGQIGVVGDAVLYQGVPIGSASGGTNSTPLRIDFSENSATPTAVQALLRSITFSNSNLINPNNTTRTLEVTLNDGDGATRTMTKSLTFSLTNDPPVVTIPTPSINVTENLQRSLSIDSTLIDLDSTNFDSGTLTVQMAGGATATETLKIGNYSYISLSGSQILYLSTNIGSWTGGTNSTPLVITLNANATATNTQALLRALAYVDTENNPTQLTRVVNLQMSDGDGGTTNNAINLTILPVNDPPTLTTSTNAVSFVEDGPAIVIMPDADVNDPDSIHFGGGYLQVRNFYLPSSDDRVAIQPAAGSQLTLTTDQVFYGANSIGAFSGGGVNPLLEIYFTNYATLAVVEELIQSITYDNINHINPEEHDRTIRFQLNDGNGNALVYKDVKIVTNNDVPVLGGIPTNMQYEEDAPLEPLFPNLEIEDLDSPVFQNGYVDVSIPSGAEAADNLVVIDQGSTGIQVAGEQVFYDQAFIGTLSTTTSPLGLRLTFGSFSNAAIAQAFARSIAFSNQSSQPATQTRVVQFIVNDSDTGETQFSVNLNVTAYNDAPTLSNVGGGVNYVENGAPVALFDTQIAVNDVDSANFEYGILTIALADFDPAQDRWLIDPGSTSVSLQTMETDYQVLVDNVVIGSLVGYPQLSQLAFMWNDNATAGRVTQLLRSLQYYNTSEQPVLATRALTLTLSDGDGSSLSGDVGISEVIVPLAITPLNDAPVASSTSLELTMQEDESLSINIATLVSNELYDPDGDPLTLLILASDAVPVLGTVMHHESPNEIVFTALDNVYGTDAFNFTVSDGQGATLTFSVNLTILPVNDLPTIAAVEPLIVINEDAGEQTVILSGITAGGNESQPLRVTATSSNPILIPDPTIDENFALHFQPLLNQYGSSIITITVEDAGLDGDLSTLEDNGTASIAFEVVVSAVNDLPTIAAMEPLVVNEDSDEQILQLLDISAGGNETQPLRVTATSSNPTLISDPSITENFELHFQPLPNQYGSSIITITVEDAGLDGDLNTLEDNGVATISFEVQVSGVNDPAVILNAGVEGVFVENAAPSLIFPATIEVVDPDTQYFAGGALTLQLVGYDSQWDVFSVANEGTAAGQVGFSTNIISYGGVPVGTRTTDGISGMRIDFNSDASLEAVTEVLRAVTYQNNSENPTTIARQLIVSIGDGIGTETNSSIDVRIEAENDLPVGGSDTFYVATNGTLAVSFSELLINDTDVDGNSLEVVGVGVVPAHGSVSYDAQLQRIVYTPASGWTGQDTFTYKVADAQGGIVIGQVVVHTTAPPNISIQGTVGSEGGELVFQVRRTGVTSFVSKIDYALNLSGTTAELGTDFNFVNGTLTFLPGETVQTISVTTVQDSVSEEAERLQIELLNPVNAQLASGFASALGVIEDDDNYPFTADVMVGNFHLQRDTGISATDFYTVDGRVLANVGGSYVGTVTIEFDHRGDGIADGEVVLLRDGLSGKISYDPRVSEPELANASNHLNLKYRLLAWESSGVLTISPWQDAISYTLQAENYVPIIQVLAEDQTSLPNEAGQIVFGEVPLGYQPVKTITIKNVGTEPLAIDGASFQVPSGYSIVSLPAAEVAPNGGSTTFQVKLSAELLQPYMGALSFATSDPEYPLYTLGLAAVVRAASAQLAVSDTNNAPIGNGDVLDFGTVATHTSSSQSFTITNPGTEDLHVRWAYLPDGFSVTGGATEYVVQPNTSTTISLELQAEQPGSVHRTALLVTNAPNALQFELSLQGEVIANQASLEVRLGNASGRSLPSGKDVISFGTLSIGQTFDQTVTFTNHGNLPLEFDFNSMILPDGVTLDSSLVTAPLAPNASITLTLHFAPTTSGELWQTWELPTNDPQASPYRCYLFANVSDGSPVPSLRVEPISLLHDTGYGSNDRVTSDPRVAGTVVGLTTGDYARIEWDHNSDGVPEATTYVHKATANGEPNFQYDPRQAEPDFAAAGAKRLRWRVVPVGTEANLIPWTSLVFTTEPLPIVVTPMLVDDNGFVIANRTGYQPLINIQVHGPFGGATYDNTQVSIEFDHDLNARPDGSSLFGSPTANGVGVVYNPSVTDSTFANKHGYRVVQYRTRLLTADGLTTIALSPWTTFDFTLLQTPSSTALSMGAVSLSEETGGAGSRHTTYPVVQFSIYGTLATGDRAEVEFAHNWPTGTMHTVAGSVPVTAIDSLLNYDVRNPLHTSTPLQRANLAPDGEVRLSYRLKIIHADGSSSSTENDWQELQPFYWDAIPLSTTTVAVQLTDTTNIANTPNIPLTYESKLKLRVSGVATEPVVLEVKWDGNAANSYSLVPVYNAANGGAWEIVDQGGDWSFGTHSVEVRAKIWSEMFLGYQETAWTALSFEYQRAPAPAIDSLAFQSNTNASAPKVVQGDIGNTVPAYLSLFYENTVLDSNQNTVVLSQGVAYPNTAGEFSFTPNIVNGSQTIRVRTGYVIDSTTTPPTYTYGPWKLLALDYQPTVETNVSTFVLATDVTTTNANGQKITSDLSLSGTILGTNTSTSLSGVSVEVAENYSLTAPTVFTASAVVTTDTTGKFTYGATFASAGGVMTMAARTKRWDPVIQSYVYGAIMPYTFEYQPLQFTAATLSLSLAKPLSTQVLTQSRDPAVQGTVTVSALSNAAYLEVEFDHVRINVSDPFGANGSTFTDAAGKFTYAPVGYGVGAHEIWARTKEWNPITRTTVYGAPVSFTYTVLAHTNNAPTLDTFALAADTGIVGDHQTADPLVRGTLTNPDGNPLGMVVEIDFNSDGVSEDVTTADASGAFQYRATSLPYNIDFTLAARAAEWNATTGQYQFSSWKSLVHSFQRVIESPISAAILPNSFHTLENENLSGDVSDPTVAGYVQNDRSLAKVVVEIQVWNEDSTEMYTQQQVVTDDFGYFQYTPSDIPENEILTIRARALDVNSANPSVPLVSAWETINTSWNSSIYPVPQLSSGSLDVVHSRGIDAQGIQIAGSPAIQGTLTSTSSSGFSGTSVLLDWTPNSPAGSNAPDGVASVNDEGEFIFYIPNLTMQTAPYTVRATPQFIAPNGTIRKGTPIDLTFVYQSAPSDWARIEYLRLKTDTGTASTDKVSANPAVAGKVANVTAPVDVDLTFVINGQTYTETIQSQANGSFEFDPHDLFDAQTIPSELPEGVIAVEAILDTGNSDSFGDAYGTEFSYVFSAAPDSAAAQNLTRIYSDYVASWSALGTTFDDAILKSTTIATAHKSALGALNLTSASNASAGRSTALQTALDAYRTSSQQADANSALANTTRAGQYSNRDAPMSFAGFEFPQAPAAFEFELPEDSEQPTAPARPAENGVPYDWEHDIAYQSAIKNFESVFENAKNLAETTYKTAEATANANFSQQESAAKNGYDVAVLEAQREYQTALTRGVNLFDVASATTRFNQESARLTAEKADKLSRNYTAEQAEFFALGAARSAALGQLSPEDKQGRREVNQAYDIKVQIAQKKWRELDYSVKVNYEIQYASLQKSLADVQASHDRWNADRQANASKTQAVTLNLAAKTRDDSLAEAARLKTNALAQAAYNHDDAVLAAWRTKVENQSNARSAPVAAWDSALDTPWTNYYKAMIDHDVSYVTAIIPEMETRDDQSLLQTKSELESIAGLKKTTEVTNNTKRQTQADNDALSKWRLALKVNETNESIRKQQTLLWNQYQTNYHNLTLDWANEFSVAIYTFEINKIDLEYKRLRADPLASNISSRSEYLLPISLPYIPTGTELSTEQQAFIHNYGKHALANYEYLASDEGGLHSAFRDFVESKVKLETIALRTKNEAWHTYSENYYTTEQDLEVKKAGFLETSEKEQANYAATYAKQYASNYAQFLTDSAAVSKTAAEAIAGFNETFTTKQQEAELERDKLDVESLAEYRTTVAEEYKSLVTTWSTNLGDWGAYIEGLATSAVTQVTTYAGAITSFAAAMLGTAGLERTRLAAYTTNLKWLATDAATAEDQQAQDTAAAVQKFAEDTADARKVFAHSAATAKKVHTTEVAEKNAEYKQAINKIQLSHGIALSKIYLNPNFSDYGSPIPTDTNWEYMANAPHLEHEWYISFTGYSSTQYSNTNQYYAPFIETTQIGLNNEYESFTGDPQPYINLNAYGSHITSNPNSERFEFAKQVTSLQYDLFLNNLSGGEFRSQKNNAKTDYLEKLRTVDEANFKKLFEAERSRILGESSSGNIGILGAHKTWVLGLADADVTFAQAIHTASGTLADALQSTTSTLAEDQAKAVEGLSNGLSAAEKKYLNANATSNENYQTGVTPKENDYIEETTDADNIYREESVAARGTYDTEIYSDQKTMLDTANAPIGSALASLLTYQRGQASEEINRLGDYVSARNLRETNRSSEIMGRLIGDATGNFGAAAAQAELPARSSLTTTEAGATKTLVQGENGAVDTLNQETAEALREAIAGVRAAESASAAAQMKAETAYNVKRAQAARQFDETTEDKAIEYNNTVFAAKNIYWNAYVSIDVTLYEHPAIYVSNEYVAVHDAYILRLNSLRAAIAAANTPYNTAIKQAKVDHAKDIGDARKIRSDAVADAKKTRETDAGTALVTAQNDLNTAEGKYVATVNPLYDTYAATAGGAERDLTKNEAALDVAFTTASGGHDVTFAEDTAEADKDFAREVAKLEIDYHTGNNSISLAWCGTQVASTTNPQPTEYQQFYLQQQAQQAWLLALKTDYATFAEAMADAAGDAEVARVQAGADFSVAVAENAQVRTGADADRWYDEGVDETAASGAYDAAETGMWNALSAAIPAEDKSLQVNYAGIEKIFLGKLTQAESVVEQAIADNNGSLSSAADAAWKTSQASAYAAQILASASAAYGTWATKLAAAAETFGKDENKAAFEYLATSNGGGVYGREQARAVDLAAAIQTQQSSDLADTLQYNLDLRSAANARRTAEFKAQADWITADYTQRDARLDAIATNVNLPLIDFPAAQFEAQYAQAKLDWWTNADPNATSAGKALWLQLATNLNTADNTFTTNVNTEYTTRQTVQINAEHTFAGAEANDILARNLAELSSDKDYGDTVETAGKTYRLAHAAIRQEYANRTAQSILDNAANFNLSTAPSGFLADDASFPNNDPLLQWVTVATNKWQSTEASAHAEQLADYADAKRTFVNDWSAARVTQGHTILDSIRDRDVNLAEDSRLHDVALADLLKTYEIAQATSAADAIADLELSLLNNFDLLPYAQEATDKADTEKLEQIAQANAKHTQSVSNANAEEASRNQSAQQIYTHDLTTFDDALEAWIASELASVERDTSRAEMLKSWSRAATAGAPNIPATPTFDLTNYNNSNGTVELPDMLWQNAGNPPVPPAHPEGTNAKSPLPEIVAETTGQHSFTSSEDYRKHKNISGQSNISILHTLPNNTFTNQLNHVSSQALLVGRLDGNSSPFVPQDANGNVVAGTENLLNEKLLGSRAGVGQTHFVVKPTAGRSLSSEPQTTEKKTWSGWLWDWTGGWSPIGTEENIQNVATIPSTVKSFDIDVSTNRTKYDDLIRQFQEPNRGVDSRFERKLTGANYETKGGQDISKKIVVAGITASAVVVAYGMRPGAKSSVQSTNTASTNNRTPQTLADRTGNLNREIHVETATKTARIANEVREVAPVKSSGIIPTLQGNVPQADKWIRNGGRVIYGTDGSMTYIKNGVSIHYNSVGYPDFTKHLYKGTDGLNQVRITLATEGSKATRYRLDYDAANAAAGFKNGTPKDYTWHHHEDTGLMQLVREDVHRVFWHSGGMSLNK
jgi:Bacterial Ig domain/A nuclease of the HNH/ENDO VII superfamily with conserved WHH/Cadherin-like domain/Calx-beta domain/RTX calcium-binding nonapeptide repeat (4 copies)